MQCKTTYVVNEEGQVLGVVEGAHDVGDVVLAVGGGESGQDGDLVAGREHCKTREQRKRRKRMLGSVRGTESAQLNENARHA